MAVDKSIPVMEGAEARVKPAGDGGVTLGANALSDPTAGDHIVGMKPHHSAASGTGAGQPT